MILLIWAVARGNDKDCDSYDNKPQEINTIVNNNKTVKWEGFDTLSFNEAFNQMYLKYGEGHIFDWRSNVYITNLKGE